MSTEEKLEAGLLDFADDLVPVSEFYADEITLLIEAASAISRLSAEVQELREALRPFAECEPGPDDPLWGKFGDDETVSVLVEAANVKRARAALKPEPVND